MYFLDAFVLDVRHADTGDVYADAAQEQQQRDAVQSADRNMAMQSRAAHIYVSFSRLRSKTANTFPSFLFQHFAPQSRLWRRRLSSACIARPVFG